MRSLLPRRRVTPFVFFLLTAALVALGSCGEGTTEPGDDDADPDADPDPDFVACEWIALSATSAVPGSRVELGVVPDSFAELTWVDARAPDDTTAGHTWLEVDDGGTAVMVAPIHPLGDPDGGDVELTVTDGTSSCAPEEFTIEALPEAPGTFAAAVDSLQAAVAVRAGIMGTTPEALAAASFDTLTEELFPLAMVHAVVSDPDHPNSLVAIAAGTSDRFGDVDLTMADRLLARSGFPDMLAAHLDRLRDVAATVPTSTTSAASAPRSAGTVTATRVDGDEPTGDMEVAAQSDDPQDYNCIGITTAFELDFCMREAVEAARSLEGATGTLMNDMGSLAGTAGLVPHAGVQAGAAIVGGGVWLAQTLLGAYAGLLPSKLETLTFDLTKATFMEDEEGTGQWENAEITASRTGWGADKAILEGIVQVTGLRGGYQGVANRFKGHPELDMQAGIDYMIGGQVQAAIDMATAGEDFIQWDPKTYGPVPVDADEWTDSKVDALGVLELVDRQTYEPRRPGTGYVILTNDPGTFGDQTVTAQRAVEISEIEVDIQPAAQRADPGEEIPFLVQTENAAHPQQLEVEAHLGTISDLTYEENGVHTFLYTAPGQADFTDFITATHRATTGALGHTGDTPLDQADVTSKAELFVEPIAACLEEVGDDTTFTATVVGLEDTSVTWEITKGPGTIDNSGVYTATEPGTAILEVTAVADTTLRAGAQVTIGGCDCWWSVQISGVPTFGSGLADESWLITYGISDGQLTSIGLQGDDTAGRHGDLTVYPGAPSGVPLVPGAYEGIGIGSYVVGSSITHQFGSDSLPPLTVSLLENDSSRVEGDITGPVVVNPEPIAEDNSYVGYLTATFRITPNATAEVAPGSTLFHCEWPWD